MGNNFVFNELHSTDPEKSRSFFGELFDWEFEDVNMGDMQYAFIKSDGNGQGGIIKQMAPDAPSMFLSYVQVDDIVASTEKAKELGGTAMVENQPAGGFGHFSVLQDPTGAVFALWQEAEQS